MRRDVALIGVPTNSSGAADGVARAPAVLRQSPAVKVSAAYGNVRIWPGDTFGIAPLPDGSICLTWGSAVGARKTSAIYASVVTI